jgi:tRNA threonylcarbamoyladenosine modification (KEOPS) complex Cgi121 subunit
MHLIDEIDGYYLLSMAFAKAKVLDPEHTLKRLRSINNRVDVQLVKADMIAGPEHVQFAARNALASFKASKRRSKSLAMELLLYLSCQRQIAKAIRLLGINSEDSQVALVALSDSEGAIRELAGQSESIIDGNRDDGQIEIRLKQKIIRLQRSYGVTRKEMEAASFEGESDSSVLKRMIVERSALLDLGD